MDDERTLREFIRQQIVVGRPREIIFDLINCKFNNSQTIYSKHRLLKWLGQTRRKEEEEIPEECRLPLRIIQSEFQKARVSLNKRTCPNAKRFFECKLFTMTDRYALDMNSLHRDTFQLFLFDVLYEQKRALKTKNKSLEFDRYSQWVAIDSEYFLLFNHKHLNSYTCTCDVHLLFLNVRDLSYKRLDTTTIDGYFVNCVVDATLINKFVVFCNNKDGPSSNIDHIYNGQILNGKLKLDKLSDFKFKLIGSTLKYEDNKIYGFEAEKFDDEETIYYKELDLNPIKTNYICKMEIDEDVNIHNLKAKQSVWVDHNFYSITALDTDDVLLKFDAKTGKMSKLRLLGVCQVMDLIAKDGGLIACTSKNNQHMAVQILGPPKLFTLAMKTIRQKLMFASKKQYTVFVQGLPPKLRPFEQ